MKCVCPMGGDRTCPDDCPLAVWANLSSTDRKAQRKSVAEKLYRQGMTQEQIAIQLGVSHMTISRDLNSFNPELKPPRPKGGRPKGSRKTPQTDRAYREIREAQSEGRPVPPKKKLAKAIGVSHMTVEKALDRIHQEQDQVRTEDQALAQAPFSDKSKLTIENAIRIHKARLDKQFEQRVNEEVRRRIEAANDAMRAENKRLRQENINLTRVLGEQGIFALTEYNSLLRAMHPDRIQRFGDADMIEEFKTATQLLIKKKARLIFHNGAS